MTAILDRMNHLVGAKGQVVIPKEIRDALGIRPGQEVVFERRGHEVVVRTMPQEALLGRFANIPLTDALLQERADDQELETSWQ